MYESKVECSRIKRILNGWVTHNIKEAHKLITSSHCLIEGVCFEGMKVGSCDSRIMVISKNCWRIEVLCRNFKAQRTIDVAYGRNQSFMNTKWNQITLCLNELSREVSVQFDENLWLREIKTLTWNLGWWSLGFLLCQMLALVLKLCSCVRFF